MRRINMWYREFREGERLCGGLHHGNFWFNGPDENDIEEPMSPLEAMLESHPQIRGLSSGRTKITRLVTSRNSLLI